MNLYWNQADLCGARDRLLVAAAAATPRRGLLQHLCSVIHLQSSSHALFFPTSISLLSFLVTLFRVRFLRVFSCAVCLCAFVFSLCGGRCCDLERCVVLVSVDVSRWMGLSDPCERARTNERRDWRGEGSWSIASWGCILVAPFLIEN